MQKTSIHPSIFQPFFESAANAGMKGQAQYFTPVDWSRALSQALPRYRPTVVDLTCGAGHLLGGASRGSTTHLLGCDIDPTALSAFSPSAFSLQPSAFVPIPADLCLLLPLLRAVKFKADCFVLNPPWDLHWYREALALLAESDLSTVRTAFAAWDGRTPKECIDSTIATLCLALDCCSDYGEGFLIANESTLQRLLFAPNARHKALSMHIWAHLTIDGNICQGGGDVSSPLPASDASAFKTGVIYFARSHDLGPDSRAIPHLPSNLEQVCAACVALSQSRLTLRVGPEIRQHAFTDDTVSQWKAVAEEWARLHPAPSATAAPHWNLWLRSDGTIGTNLSLFDTASSRVTKSQAESLFALDGRQPIRLVMQRQQRAQLERAVAGNGGPGGSPWRVDPKLQAAVANAVTNYHRVRAPLYPLSPIQRLGYLDEQDTIECCQDLEVAHRKVFRADHTYTLRSCTIAVRRSGTKMNLSGGLDDVEWDGQELAFFITDDFGVERVFMEARLRNDKVRLSLLQPGEKPGRQDEDNLEECRIDFTLQDLVTHFLIPDVPDVARVNPQGYEQNLRLLSEIESLCV